MWQQCLMSPSISCLLNFEWRMMDTVMVRRKTCLCVFCICVMCLMCDDLLQFLRERIPYKCHYFRLLVSAKFSTFFTVVPIQLQSRQTFIDHKPKSKVCVFFRNIPRQSGRKSNKHLNRVSSTFFWFSSLSIRQLCLFYKPYIPCVLVSKPPSSKIHKTQQSTDTYFLKESHGTYLADNKTNDHKQPIHSFKSLGPPDIFQLNQNHHCVAIHHSCSVNITDQTRPCLNIPL